MNEELENILSKVRDLYRKYGIKSITMDDVARELGMSKKTLYQYVNDKEDLVDKFVEAEIRVRQEQICRCFRTGSNAIEELFEISLFMNRMMREGNPATEYDLKKYYPVQYQKIVKARREGIYSYLLLNLTKGKKEGLYREDVNEEIIAKLYISRTENLPFSEIFTVSEFTSFQLFVEILKYHIRGIATEKGIIELENKMKGLEDKIKGLEKSNI